MKLFAITTYVQRYTGGSGRCDTGRKEELKRMEFENEAKVSFTSKIIFCTE